MVLLYEVEENDPLKNTMLRTLTALLAVLAVGTAMASCGSQTPSGTDTADVGTDSSVVTEAPDPAAVYGLQSEDFGGAEMKFYVTGSNADCGAAWESFDIFAETETGDIVIDAVFARNAWVEETYNVKITEYKPTTDTAADTMKNAVAAGDSDGDALVESFERLCSLATNGYLLDMAAISDLKLDSKWWDQGAIDGVSIGGHVYMATGDLLIVDNDATWVLMFNKQLAEEFDYNFYTMIDENKWLFEDFFSIARDTAMDLNGDGKMKIDDDRYGLVTAYNTPEALITAAGLTLSTKDANDIPVMETDLEKLSAVIATAGEFYADKNVVYGSDYQKAADAFVGGRGLFYGEVLQCVTRMRESNTDFGMIPWPKYEASQENYYSFIIPAAGHAVALPTTLTDTHMAAVVLDAMAAKSMDTLTVAYYDKALTQKYMRDENSIRMLDMIIGSRIFDQSHFYMYGWGDMYSKMAGNLQNGRDLTMSTWEKNIDKARADLEATVAAFEANAQ